MGDISSPAQDLRPYSLAHATYGPCFRILQTFFFYYQSDSSRRNLYRKITNQRYFVAAFCFAAKSTGAQIHVSNENAYCMFYT